MESMIRTWDVATGSEAGVPLKGHTSGAFVLVLSPDGRRLASGSSDGTVIIWDVLSRTRLTRLFGHSGGILALSFSSDGRMLASGGYDQIIRLWDLNNEKPAVLLRGHEDQVHWLSFSPDGQSLLYRGQSGLTKLWRANLGLEDNVLISSPESLNDVALSPDGRLLASVTDQNFAVNNSSRRLHQQRGGCLVERRNLAGNGTQGRRRQSVGSSSPPTSTSV
jgi:WD40 repeat protein